MSKMKNAFLILSLAAVLSGCAQTAVNNSVPQASPSVEQKQKAILVITNGTASSQNEFTFKSGETVLDVMKTLKSENKIDFVSKDGGMGAFIEEINATANDGSKNMYWMLYVNDKLAESGASVQKINAGDKIEWKYVDASTYGQ